MITLYPFLLIWQGGDLTDTGYHAVYSQNFFSDLNAGNVNYKTILTDFIGNIWMEQFPGLGIWGLRLLSLLFIQGGILLAFLTLKDIGPRIVILAGLFCAQMFALRYTSMIYNYDFVSFFFLMLTAYCMWNGIRCYSFKWLFVSGFVSGLAFLSRFPDILILGFVPLIFLHAELNCHGIFSPKEIILNITKKYAVFLVGFFTLFCLFIFILISTDTFDVYFNNLYGVSNNLTKLASSSDYSLLNLIFNYFRDIKRFFPYLFWICMVAIAFFSVLQSTQRKVVYFILIMLCIALAFIIFYGDFSYRNTFKYFVPALCVLSSIIILLFNKTETKQYGSLILIAWMTAFVSFGGTNTGMFLKLCFGMPLLLPLLGVLMWNRNVETFWKLHVAWRPLVLTSAVIIIIISGIIRFGWIYHVDSGLLCRFSAVYQIEHTLMRNIYTTAERVKHIEDVTNAIQRQNTPKNSLLIYGHEPLFYYLSQMKPAVFKFWMSGGASKAQQIFNQIDVTISQTSKYPMILVTDNMCLGKEGSDILKEFIDKYHYRCVEDSDRFQIWNIESESVLPSKVDMT